MIYLKVDIKVLIFQEKCEIIFAKSRELQLFCVRKYNFSLLEDSILTVVLLAVSNAKFYFQHLSQILSRCHDNLVSRNTALRPGDWYGFLAEAGHHIHTGSVAQLFCFAVGI